jgi:Cysteine rich repeat
VLKAVNVKACAADVKQFCADTKPGEGRVEACIKAHFADLKQEADGLAFKLFCVFSFVLVGIITTGILWGPEHQTPWPSADAPSPQTTRYLSAWPWHSGWE